MSRFWELSQTSGASLDPGIGWYVSFELLIKENAEICWFSWKNDLNEPKMTRFGQKNDFLTEILEKFSQINNPTSIVSETSVNLI